MVLGNVNISGVVNATMLHAQKRDVCVASILLYIDGGETSVNVGECNQKSAEVSIG